MITESLEVGAFAENCYLVACEKTRKGVVIDPGDEIPRIVSSIKTLEIDITQILLTHGHLDHVKEVAAFKKEFDAPILMHANDQFLLDNLPVQAAAFGMTTAGIPTIDRYIVEGDIISFGECQFSVLHTPGHSPGSVTFVDDKHAFVGDVVFSGSVGRTDLPGGNMNILVDTIKTKLLPLGDAVLAYPGHGPPTTMGHERKFNPFLK